MGFMDKAKKMAGQAQQRIGETRKHAFEQEGDEASEPGAGGVRFDERGKPIRDETTRAQEESGVPTGESMQAEPGTIPAGPTHAEQGSAHEPVKGERPADVDHPGEGQPPASRVERSGAAGNAEGNQGTSPVEADDVHTTPETKK